MQVIVDPRSKLISTRICCYLHVLLTNVLLTRQIRNPGRNWVTKKGHEVQRTALCNTSVDTYWKYI